MIESTKSQWPSTLDDWLCYIDSLHSKEIDMGLGRIAAVAQRLNVCHLPAKVILLAGTNGKGTTSRFIEAYLLTQGATVGVFNSPQLRHYNEQVRINGNTLTDERHIDAFSEIERQRGDISLTPFEYSTLGALLIFARLSLDYVIVEVGMGGRLDSTNVVEPDISVITTIDVDHQAFLGDDRETIGFEKAGIFRANKPAIVGDFNIPTSVIEHAKAIQAPLICANQQFSILEQEDQQSWQWQSGELKLASLTPPNIPIQNVSTALATLQYLDVELNAQLVNQVLASLVVEGRLQSIADKPRIIVDVAHNPESAKYLAKQLANYQAQGVSRIKAVVGMLKDKDIAQVFAIVSPFIQAWYLSELDTPRTANIRQLTDTLEKLDVRPYSTGSVLSFECIDQALKQAKQDSDEDDLIIVFGSFFTVAAALTATEL